MAYLGAAVVLVGLVCALNLLLTVGVVRRLREHTQQFADLNNRNRPALQPRPGAVIADFDVADTDGRPVARGLLDTGTLVGFFAPDCGPCKELLPRFVEHATALREQAGEVFAVVASTTEDRELIAKLSSVARVIVEPPNGPTIQAFGISGFPTLVLVGGDGVVAAAGTTVESVRQVAVSPA
jgi:thiol-disulfide isomerase/thioredoxin